MHAISLKHQKQNFQTKYYLVVLANLRRQSSLTEHFDKICVHDHYNRKIWRDPCQMAYKHFNALSHNYM